MFAPQVIQGRWLGAEDLEALQRLIAEHPHWSRRRLSIALCEALNWRTASGQLKDMSARLLLNKLAERGFVKLPPRQRGGGRQILRALPEPELFSLSAGAGELIEGLLRALEPLEVIPVEPRTTQANAFVWHLGQVAAAMLRQWYSENPARLLQAALLQAERLTEMAPELEALRTQNASLHQQLEVKTKHIAQLEEALQAAQRAEHRQAAPFRVEPQKRAVAPKRPGRALQIRLRVASIQNTNAHQGNGILSLQNTYIWCSFHDTALSFSWLAQLGWTSQEHGIMF